MKRTPKKPKRGRLVVTLEPIGRPVCCYCLDKFATQRVTVEAWWTWRATVGAVDLCDADAEEFASAIRAIGTVDAPGGGA